MLGTRDLFISLKHLPNIFSVSIADGRLCQVAGEGVVHASSRLQLDNILYVPNFPVNLLSISAITKTLFCYVTFFSCHYTF